MLWHKYLSMVRALKKYFIPHKGNDHKPHFLRREVVLVVMFVALIAELAFLTQSFIVLPRVRLLADILTNVLIDETNTQRTERGLPPLTENSLLDIAAQRKAKDMANKGYFAHTSPDGTTPWEWFREAGYRFASAGENLAVNFTDSVAVVDAWMNSPAHRDNVLGGRYADIGIGIAHGTFEGHEAIYVVQLFGNPATTPQAIVSASPSETAPPSLAATETHATVRGAIEEEPAPPEIPKPPPAPSLTERAVSSPFATARVLYAAIAALALGALFLKIFVRFSIQHPRLIAHGVLLIVLVASLVLLNKGIATASVHIL